MTPLTAVHEHLRSLGPVLDMPAMKALYADTGADRLPEGCVTLQDRVYGPDPLQRLDVYLPVARSSPKSGTAAVGKPSSPVVVLVHGGGFIRGDKRERANGGIQFARNGYLTIVPNYRLAPAAPWPAGAADIAAVWTWAQREVVALGGDPGRIVLIGESAGATHVATATLVRKLHPSRGLRPAGVVLISGPYDPTLEYSCRSQFGIASPDPRNDAYFGSDAAGLAQRSLVDLIDVPPLPVLITFAQLDLLHLQVQAAGLFAAMVRTHGFTPEIAMIRHHNHLSQCFSLNTDDEALAAPIGSFLRRVTRIEPA